ncbi:hypothetical protein VNO77_15757 [Canavalia gladiata]|uniref:Uncharacterized protein n=1 Tax=Canavalia gladiata TaxID=3824 RepID=A0AAN9M0J0_CANGL
MDSLNQPGLNLIVNAESRLNSAQCGRSPGKFNKLPYGNFLGSNFLPIEQHKLFIDDAALISRSPSTPSKGNQDHTESDFANPIFIFVIIHSLIGLYLLHLPVLQWLANKRGTSAAARSLALFCEQLALWIEEQGKQLKMMFDQQQETKAS